MPYFIYSHEALPNPALMGKPRYTPDGDYIRWGGVTLPCLPAQTWLKLEDDDRRYTTRHRQLGSYTPYTEQEIPLKRFMPVVKNQFSERGVVMLDHEPSKEEKESIERACAEENLRFRKKAIEFFESKRQEAIGRQGTYEPSPYIDECYDILGMSDKKPYSLEAIKEMRSPGEKAAERIAHAIAEGQKEAAKATAEAIADVLTRPKQTEMPAARR